MQLIRIEFVEAPNKPPMLGHVAEVPGQGERINLGAKSFYIQSATTVIDPKPGDPVAIIRVIE